MAFAHVVIANFATGLLDLRMHTTLRSVLSAALRCQPMRVSVRDGMQHCAMACSLSLPVLPRRCVLHSPALQTPIGHFKTQVHISLLDIAQKKFPKASSLGKVSTSSLHMLPAVPSWHSSGKAADAHA